MQEHTKKRHYSDEFKSCVLASFEANRRNLRQTAQEWSIPAGTLQRWVKGEGGVTVSVLVKVEERKRDLEEKWNEIAHSCLDLAAGKLHEASFADLIRAGAIAVDKRQLLRGEATEIHGQMPLTREEAIERIKRCLRDRVVQEAVDAEVFPLLSSAS